MALLIRRYTTDDAAHLRAVFLSAIHGTAKHYYTEQQLNAWAPLTCDEEAWQVKMNSLMPFVAELDGRIVGYADLQASGYIDQFFVSAPVARRGIGSALMTAIQTEADRQGIRTLTSDVSLAAEAFYSAKGFRVEYRKTVAVRGQTLDNALMRKGLA